MPMNFERHLENVASLKPALRQISATGILASACLRNPMICSSLYLLLLVPAILLMSRLCVHNLGTAAGEQVTTQCLNYDAIPRALRVNCYDARRRRSRHIPSPLHAVIRPAPSIPVLSTYIRRAFLLDALVRR